MKKSLFCICICLMLLPCAALMEGNEMLPMPKYINVSVHDPSIIKADDGWFYIYGSHMTAAKSQDLMSWEMISKGPSNAECTLVENVQEAMKESLTYSKTNTFWAPDVIQLADGKYYLYYCTCEGSSPLSTIGIAVSDKPEGPYVNQGFSSNRATRAITPPTIPTPSTPAFSSIRKTDFGWFMAPIPAAFSFWS